MAVFLPTPPLPHYPPQSPDPTPLRMIAFSVAESALQTDPNSPLFGTGNPNIRTRGERSLTAQTQVDTEGEWNKGSKENWNDVKLRQPDGFSGRRGKPLWEVVERAKERRALDIVPKVGSLPPSPPISPGSYNFILPAHSPLAAAIAASSLQKPSPQLSLSPTRFPLYTRSAEPSPTKSTFSALDQTLPPPEFVPRLSASDFENGVTEAISKLSLRPEIPQARKVEVVSRHTAKLPSLAQIQARVGSHRRRASLGTVPLPRTRDQASPIGPTGSQEQTEEALEILRPVTPGRRDPQDVLREILNRRPPTPPSPRTKVSRLPAFLRARTLSNDPPSYRPETGTIVRRSSTNSPVLHVTPPKTWNPSIVYSTPPSLSPPRRDSHPTNLSSPTLSIRSNMSRRGSASPSSTSSPTLSITVPIITCTPAPEKRMVDGVESDEECETDDLLVFDGGFELTSAGEAETEEDERERRGREMRSRLLQRARC